MRDIAQRLFKAANAPGIFIPDDSQIGAALAKKLTPDMAVSPAATEIGVVHRHTDSGEIYFVANTSNEPKSVGRGVSRGGNESGNLESHERQRQPRDRHRAIRRRDHRSI